MNISFGWGTGKLLSEVSIGMNDSTMSLINVLIIYSLFISASSVYCLLGFDSVAGSADVIYFSMI